MIRAIGKLCVITDTVIQNKYSHFDIAEMAIKGGADIIQLRDKIMPTNELIETAIMIRILCRKKNKVFIVNDRPDIALISEADGVHLGKDDISIFDARRLLGKDMIIGATANSLVDAIEAEQNGADYIGYGHIFPTYTKIKSAKARGLKNLKDVTSRIKIPIMAIGGINEGNAEEVMECGASAIAVISTVVKSNDPVSAVKELRKIVNGK
jgi:thiamine-phosphate pyrophosphorylase